MSDALHIETFTLGQWMTNCYVAYTDAGNCWIIDCGFEPEDMFEFIEEKNLTPQQVVLTHAHVDHIAGLPSLRRRWKDLPIVIHEAEREYPGDPALNLSIALAEPIVAPEPTSVFLHGDTLMLDGIGFEVRHTPGHSPGGVCLYQQEHHLAIVGDTLFAGSIGRSDFPTSNSNDLLNSIRTQLLTLPDDTRVLPGHGPATTIGTERRTNPFLT